MPKISKIDRKDDLVRSLKEKDYVVLGYTAPGNTKGLASITKTVGKLATTIKSVLKSKSTAELNLIELYLAKSEFVLSTNTVIAQKFGLEQGVKYAVIIIFKDPESAAKSLVFSILEKRFEDNKNPIEVEPMMQSLQHLFFERPEKDEL